MPVEEQISPVPTQEPGTTSTKTISLSSATPETSKYPEVSLKINSSPLTSFAPIFIAEAEGYFTEFGLKMEYVTFNKSTDAVPLVITGDLDVFAGSINAAILERFEDRKTISSWSPIKWSHCTGRQLHIPWSSGSQGFI